MKIVKITELCVPAIFAGKIFLAPLQCPKNRNEKPANYGYLFCCCDIKQFLILIYIQICSARFLFRVVFRY